MPLLTSIADLIRQQGTDAAERIREDANIRARASQAQAQAIGNIGQTIANVPKQIQQQKQDAQQQQLTGLKLQEAQGDLTDKAAARQKHAAIQAVIAKYGEDHIDQAVPEVYKIDYGIGSDLDRHVTEAKKNASDQQQREQKQIADAQKQKAEWIASTLNAATDPGTYAKQRFTVMQAYPDDPEIKQLPADFTEAKPVVASFVRRTLPPEKQVELDQKRAAEERQSAAQQSTEQHQRTMEELTAGNTSAANARLEGQASETARHNRAMEARPVGGMNAGATGLEPDAVAYGATAYRLLGPSSIPTRISGEDRVKIMNAAAKESKAIGLTPAAAVTKQLATKGDAASLTQITKMAASADAFENKALGQADIIAGLSAKVPRTKSPLINAAIQSGRTNITGDEDATKLANAISTFSAEYAKIMEGSTGSAAASSDSARRAAERLINTGMSKGTMQGVLDLMKQEMRLTIQGYDVAKGHITDHIGGTPQQPAPTQEKVVSAAQLQAIAKKNGTTLEQETQRATAAGYVVR